MYPTGVEESRRCCCCCCYAGTVYGVNIRFVLFGRRNIFNDRPRFPPAVQIGERIYNALAFYTTWYNINIIYCVWNNIGKEYKIRSGALYKCTRALRHCRFRKLLHITSNLCMLINIRLTPPPPLVFLWRGQVVVAVGGSSVFVAGRGDENPATIPSRARRGNLTEYCEQQPPPLPPAATGCR